MTSKLTPALGLVVAFALIAGGFAVAAVPRTRAIPHISPEKFSNLIVEPAAVCSVDFPVIPSVQVGLTSACVVSATCPVVGATLRDGCFAASDLGMDGGLPLAPHAFLNCRAVTEGVVFQLCSITTDGGSYDLPATGLTGRIIH